MCCRELSKQWNMPLELATDLAQLALYGASVRHHRVQCAFWKLVTRSHLLNQAMCDEILLTLACVTC